MHPCQLVAVGNGVWPLSTGRGAHGRTLSAVLNYKNGGWGAQRAPSAGLTAAGEDQSHRPRLYIGQDHRLHSHNASGAASALWGPGILRPDRICSAPALLNLQRTRKCEQGGKGAKMRTSHIPHQGEPPKLLLPNHSNAANTTKDGSLVRHTL